MWGHARKHLVIRARHWLRSSEAALILIAVAAGLAAGLATVLQSTLAHGLQQIFYGIGINRLSALASIEQPWRLLALPLGGMALALLARSVKSRRTPIDVVEANALHGGRVPFFDSLLVSGQTLLSNGSGASVGLEAAYAQAGGCIASTLGRWVGLRRTEMRILVGSGAGAAIGAAFGAPLAGAFYGFEIVVGAYTPAAIAPVVAAALAARLVTRALGLEPWLITVPDAATIATHAYLFAAALGVCAALAGIAIMRVQSLVERWVAQSPIPPFWRPVLGGLLLIPIGLASPQALSAGHGALRLDLALQPGAVFLATVFALKAASSILALSFGFRGGLFFASLFLGSLFGPLWADGVNALAAAAGFAPPLDGHQMALVGIAALSVTIVGGPMTLCLLVLESTHDFALTGLAITASLTASAFTRAHFGYSFSTWRMHLRGSAIRGPRDVSWMKTLTAARMMRRDPTVVDADLSVGAFRENVPLGATSRVLLADRNGFYRGTVAMAEAYDPALDPATPLSRLARSTGTALRPEDGIDTVLDRFDHHHAEDLAVIDSDGRILGILTEAYVRRCYATAIEKAQSSLFRE